ncbi:MMPL family transporter [Moritella marina]|uniref:MMPL family transporter n=1 Tax=Moritella marina TaxID=90736 RepID=UPI003703A3B5
MHNSEYSKSTHNKSGLKFYLLQLIAVLLLAGYQLGWGQWQIETNILSLLPTDNQALSSPIAASQKHDINQAKSALFQQANQRVFVAISGGQAMPAYQQLAKTISTFDGIENEAMTVPDIKDIVAFYQPYRDSVMTDDYQALLAAPQTTLTTAQDQATLTTAHAINNFVLGKLTQVSDPFVSGSLAIAPRLNLADFLATGLAQLQAFETEQGIIVVNKDGLKHYIMPIKVAVDGFSIKQTQAFSQQLQAEFQLLATQFDVDVLYSGVLFHTAESSQQAEFEMSTFGVISLLAVLLMILAVFRSAKPVNLALIVLAISVVYGLTAVVTLFNQLHLLTLVFAVTLIGIVIDYCFHAFVSFSVISTSKSQGGIKSIRTALCLGFITTALGYAALIMSPLSLLSQVAVFMIFGLLGALLTVLLLLPYFNLTGKISVTPSVWTLTDKLNVWLTKRHQQRRLIFVVLSLGLVSAIVIDDINFNDDIRLLNSSPAFLIENEIKMAKLMGYQHSQRIVITADDSETLLQRQETLLAQLVTQPDLTVKSMASLLPSVAKQQANNALLKSAEQQQVFELGLATLGLADTVDKFKPLTLDAFNAGPLQALSAVYIYQYQMRDDNEKYALWVETAGVALNDALQQWIGAQADMSIDNKPAEVTAALSHYRQALLLLFAGAIVVVTIVLCLRFGLGQGLLGLLSIVVSAGGALLLTQLSLGHLNIFNLLAVLLILALAIDYVIFYQEHGLQANTVLAITLSAISSALVFGVLALSVTPAVESFGLTVMFGILLVFVLAPLSAKKIAPLSAAKGEVEK